LLAAFAVIRALGAHRMPIMSVNPPIWMIGQLSARPLDRIQNEALFCLYFLGIFC